MCISHHDDHRSSFHTQTMNLETPDDDDFGLLPLSEYILKKKDHKKSLSQEILFSCSDIRIHGILSWDTKLRKHIYMGMQILKKKIK